MTTSRIFDTSTLEGLQRAERYKDRLNNKYQAVNAHAIGLNRVQIIGHNPDNHGQAPDVLTTEQMGRGL